MKPWVYYDFTIVNLPNRKDYITTYWYKAGAVYATQVHPNLPPTLAPDFTVEVTITDMKGIVKEEVLNKEEFDADMRIYAEEKSKREQEFQLDCFTYYNLLNDPRRNVMYEEAYERGHSHGHSEVFGCLGDVVELVERLDKAKETL